MLVLGTINEFPQTFSAKKSFNSTEPLECAINKYRISKIVNERSEANETDEGNFASINKNGQVTIIDEDSQDNYFVYI